MFNIEDSALFHKTYRWNERLVISREIVCSESLQRHRDRYIIIYMWKIVENVVPNLNTPITWKLSERRGRLCDVLSVVQGAVGTKC